MLFPWGAHMSHTVTDFEVHDIRFPTSEQLDGSDAMNADPDYSAAYVVLRTDAPDGSDDDGAGIEGHGFCFTIGRGNEVMATAIDALRPYVVGRPAPVPPPISVRCTASSPMTRNCAGSARRRA